MAPSDIVGIRKATHKKDIVDKFKELRRASPTGTESPMRNVGRHDIYTLHDRDGARACTWYDEEAEVCWLLGYSTQHQYEVLEARSTNDELMPSLEDLTILEQERGEYATLLGPGIKKLVEDAWQSPGVPQRGTVGGLLRLELSIVVALEFDKTEIGDLYIMLKLPPIAKGKPKPTDWPGPRLLECLAEMATNKDFDELSVLVPLEVPAEGADTRPVELSEEMAIQVTDVEHELLAAPSPRNEPPALESIAD